MSKAAMRCMSLLLVILFSMSLFTGCGQSSNKEQVKEETKAEGTVNQETKEDIPKNSWEADKTLVTLTAFFDFPISADMDITKDFGKNSVSKKLLEDTGVTLDITAAPDRERQKLNILIASGDLPDLIYLDPNLQQAKQLIQNDKVWALDELAAKYAPNFIASVPKNVLVARRLGYDSEHFYHASFFWIRPEKINDPHITKNLTGLTVEKGIYKELGSPQIKTGEDYINLLKMVKEKYPEMIPLQSTRNLGPDKDGNPMVISTALNYFGFDPNSKAFFKDGEVYKKYFEHPDFLTVLKFANTLYNEKLIDPSELTDKGEQLRSKLVSGKVFSELSQDADNLGYFSTESSKVRPNTQYIMIEPFSLSANAKPAWGGIGDASGWCGFMVTKNSKHADRAIRYIDYLYSDDFQKLNMFGIEGVNYDMKDGMPVLREEFAKAAKDDFNKTRSEVGLHYFSLFRDSYWQPLLMEQREGGYSEDVKNSFSNASKYYENMTFYDGAQAYPPDSEELKIAATIKEYYQGAIMKVLLAKPDDVEKLYNTMVSEMKKMGLDKLNAYVTKYLNEKQAKIDKYSK